MDFNIIHKNDCHDNILSNFQVSGLRSWLCVFFVFKGNPFLLLIHTNIGYDNISSKFDFQGPELKVKVIVAIQGRDHFCFFLSKNLSSL